MRKAGLDMSRYEPWQKAGLDMSRYEKPSDDEFPTLVQHRGVVEYAREKRQVTITEFLVKRAAESGKLPYSIVSAKRCFAPAHVDAWLLSLRKQVSA
jgi:hypothetical protein